MERLRTPYIVPWHPWPRRCPSARTHSLPRGASKSRTPPRPSSDRPSVRKRPRDNPASVHRVGVPRIVLSNSFDTPSSNSLTTSSSLKPHGFSSNPEYPNVWRSSNNSALSVSSRGTSRTIFWILTLSAPHYSSSSAA
jgi:hypothetical protein